MARIIYKEGCEGQNRLESIEGIEIELLNGQKALIYPKYSERRILLESKICHWDEKVITEIESLKIENNIPATKALLKCGSPAAKYVSNFQSDRYGSFGLPTLLAAMEINHQKKDINKLAATIKGAMQLEKYAFILSCSRCTSSHGWIVTDCDSTQGYYLSISNWCVPTILYR